VIRTDAKKLRHILQNLINNAIKFTDQGYVKISTRYDEKAKAVEFKVADTGRGIPKESLSEIFEMFQQVKWSDKRLDAGVGLGLHIAKKFTELLGGSIGVESRTGKGTTFTVTIPSENPPDHRSAQIH
jgi:signal transduction histidine kinase